MLSAARIDRIAETIRDSVSPDEISIFGSYAKGNATVSSDLDILVVDNSGRDKNQIALTISKALFPRDFGLDILVVSSAELAERAALVFWQSLLESRRIVYER